MTKYQLIIMINTKFLNKNFRFVYTPKTQVQTELFPEDRKEKKRFLIGGGTLAKYIGQQNAETVQKCAQNMKTDKHTVKFRKCGKIEIFLK